MGDLLRGAGVAVRTMVRRPGASIVILLTLGIGLGAATTVFSVFDRLVLGPLPFAEPDELIRLRETRALPGEGVRTFGPDEDRAGAPAPVAVLAHSLWTRRFGGIQRRGGVGDLSVELGVRRARGGVSPLDPAVFAVMATALNEE